MNVPRAKLESRIVVDDAERIYYGNTVGHLILMAIEKTAKVGVYQQKVESLLKRRRIGAIAAGDINRSPLDDLVVELDIQKDKLTRRQAEANDILDAHPLLRVSHIEDHSVITEGVLHSFDLGDATITLSKGDAREVIKFASPSPVPEYLDQQYFGHTPVIALQVLEIDAGRAGVFNY